MLLILIFQSLMVVILSVFLFLSRKKYVEQYNYWSFLTRKMVEFHEDDVYRILSYFKVKMERQELSAALSNIKFLMEHKREILASESEIHRLYQEQTKDGKGVFKGVVEP